MTPKTDKNDFRFLVLFITRECALRLEPRRACCPARLKASETRRVRLYGCTRQSGQNLFRPKPQSPKAENFSIAAHCSATGAFYPPESVRTGHRRGRAWSYPGACRGETLSNQERA